MKKFYLFSAAAIAALSVFAGGCKIYVNAPDADSVSLTSGTVVVGSGKNIVASENMISKTLDVKGVEELVVSGAINVVYLQDADTHVEFVAPDNVMEYYRYKESGGKLKVWKSDNNISITYKKDKNYPKLIIKSPVLTDLNMSGASSFVAKEIALGDKKLELDCSGASSVKIESVACRKIDVDLSGASSFKVASVKATEMDLDCSGASNITMVAEVESAEIECSGASKVTVNGKAATADFECSGASKIEASGFVVANGALSASGASSIHSNIKNVTKEDKSGVSKIKNN